ncbi:MAG: cytochrome b [Aestuariivirga sp.]
MSLKSTPERYGALPIALHWISAILILALVVAGFIAANQIDPVAKAAILRVHAPVGTLVLVLTLFRLAWWLFIDRKPVEAAGMSTLQSRASKAVHGLFYVAIIGLAASGIAMFILSGAGEILFGTSTSPLPDFWNYSPRYGHAILARLMVLLLVLHVGAALYHQFVRGDRLLARMGLGR